MSKTFDASITLEDIQEKLSTLKFTVALSPSQKAKYAKMVTAEQTFINDLEKNGAIVVHPASSENDDDLEDSEDDYVDTHNQKKHPKRRTIVIVPPNVVLPPTSNLKEQVDIWRETIEAAAELQGKSKTVGNRGATMPVWIAENGDSQLENKPDYLATKITTRQQKAYRGARVTPKQALLLIGLRRARFEESIKKSSEYRHKERIPDQIIAVKQLKEAEAKLTHYIDRGADASVRFYSGHSWRVHIRHQTGSIDTTVATVALIPGTEKTIIAPARTHTKGHEKPVEIILLPGGIELTIHQAAPL